jgi:hypothetical protein
MKFLYLEYYNYMHRMSRSTADELLKLIRNYQERKSILILYDSNKQKIKLEAWLQQCSTYLASTKSQVQTSVLLKKKNFKFKRKHNSIKK